MTLIVDPTAALEMILGRTHAPELEEMIQKANRVIAPDIYISEVPGIFSKYHEYENLPIEMCEEAMFESILIIDDFPSTSDISREAGKLSTQEGITYHDAIYLILTQKNNGTIMTLDPILKDAAMNQSIRTVDLD